VPAEVCSNRSKNTSSPTAAASSLAGTSATTAAAIGSACRAVGSATQQLGRDDRASALLQQWCLRESTGTGTAI
jgi:hypothetical protein